MAHLRMLARYMLPAVTQIVFRMKLCPPSRLKSLVMALPPLFVVKAVAPVRRKNKTNINEIIKVADNLYDQNMFEDLYNLLVEHQDSNEPEILWRLARSIYEMSKFVSDIPEKIRVLERGLEIVNRALELNDNCFAAHKWCSILMNAFWSHKDTKGRILHCLEIKKHMERAAELNPKDGTSFYLLGKWCYTMADMPWYKKKAAAVLFATLPSSSYEEAYSFFQKAEQIQPGFYSMNLLMMGKCLLKLNDKSKAIYYLKRARDYGTKTADDREAHEESDKLLKELGVTD